MLNHVSLSCYVVVFSPHLARRINGWNTMCNDTDEIMFNSLVLEKNWLLFHISALADLVYFVRDAYAVQDAADQK